MQDLRNYWVFIDHLRPSMAISIKIFKIQETTTK